jgi:hypothetical protein
VKNQLFFVEEIERAVAFGVDGVSEIAFNGWKYGNHYAALMVVGCIVDLLGGRQSPSPPRRSPRAEMQRQVRRIRVFLLRQTDSSFD